MRRFLTSLLAAGLAAGASGATNAITLPSAVVTLGDGESFDFSPLFAPNANGFALPDNTQHPFADGSIVTLGSTINTGSSFVTYSFGVTNNGGSQTYDLNIGSGTISSRAAGSLAQSSFTEFGADNTGGGGAVRPTGSNTTLLQVSGDGGDLGLSLGAPTTFPVGNPGDPIPSQGPLKAVTSLTSPLSSLGLHLGFSAPGGGDTHTFTGRISAASVPEPGALALLTGAAIPGVYGLLRRRK